MTTRTSECLNCNRIFEYTLPEYLVQIYCCKPCQDEMDKLVREFPTTGIEPVEE